MSSSATPSPGQSCPTGRLHRFKLKPVRLRFLRGPQICACQPAGSPLAIETRLAIPLHSAVIGKLFRYGKRPLDGELTTVNLTEGSAPSVELDSGAETIAMELKAHSSGLITSKKLLLWHGDA